MHPHLEAESITSRSQRQLGAAFVFVGVAPVQPTFI
jgi:hypothetical protein